LYLEAAMPSFAHLPRTLAAVLAAATLSACGSAPPEPIAQGPALQPEEEPDVVRILPRSRMYLEIQEVGDENGHAVVRAPARLAFNDGAISLVGAPIEGRVETVHVQLGDAVEQGDALVTISSPSAAAARAELSGAEVAVRAATTELARQTRMLEQGVGIESQKFEAEIQLAEAQKELARARTAAAFLGRGNGSSVVVRAPIAGTILTRRVTSGASVEPGADPMIEIGNAASLRVVAEVFERDLALVQPGAGADVTISSIQEPVRGTVTSVGGALSDGVRTAPVFIAIDESGLGLRAGMYARVHIEAGELRGPSLPAEAVLIKDGERKVVYVEEDEITFVARDVVVGPSIGGRVHVFSGLSPGDRVVVRGALLLDGAADQLL
jgi:membrane fusion protein, heavy metal efflux system